MPLTIIRNDITKIRADAVVNAANTELQMGGGVCGAIFSAAGARKLQTACDKLAPIKTGEAVITPGFNLPAKYIIHTAGPVYRGGNNGEEELLRLCYINSLNTARNKGCKSIAFPLISSGIYGYPKDEALNVATGAAGEWLLQNDNNTDIDNDIEISIVVFDKTSFEISKKLLGEVEGFIDENYEDKDNTGGHENKRMRESFKVEKSERFVRPPRSAALENIEDIESTEDKEAENDFAGLPLPAKSIAPKQKLSLQKTAEFPKPAAALDDIVKRLDEPFSQTLLKLIDAKGKTDVEVYKRANLDRKLFSKIRTGKNYIPSKKTVVALSVALELSLAETDDLLERAGFALSRSVMFDVIVEYFIANRKYNIFEINNVLFKYDQPILGG